MQSPSPPNDSVLAGFHPAVAGWFARAFAAPTAAQVAAWPAIRAGRDTLVAAPTGSGKTLTAFLSAIDALVRQGLSREGLPEATQVVYVSPLKALSNDIHLNLEAPLAGIREELARLGLPDVDIRTAVRTGDTPQSERAAMRRQPPHILVTTPESLYVLLGSESGRAMLGGTRTVIVDEIHAVAQSKRGSHLALSLERLEALCGRRLGRIGLSATQKPIEEVARFLVGTAAVAADGSPDCAIVDIGYTRERDLALELPPVPLQPVMSNEQWELVYARIAELVEAHRTTLVFVNTRRMAERAARHLAERLDKEAVAAHHGSLSKELRLDAEQRLKAGRLKVLVATASLELGIDIGDVDLVVQLGSPRAIAAFLQRVGRSGHFVGGTPKGRLFPTSREDLVECAALLDCVRRGELDALVMPVAPLDVLAQQIVAEVAAREWDEDALYDWMRRAWPYRGLSRKDYDAVVRMLADGYATRRGNRGAYIHRDAVHGRLRGRAGGRMTAVMSGGTIPDTGDYNVVLEPESIIIGSVNEDFAIESIAGDIFQLGNASYRIIRVEAGRVRVEDAQGQPPTIPFWLGEAPGRTDELSVGVSRLRGEIAARLDADNAPLVAWLVDELGLPPEAAHQLAEYCANQQAAIGAMPTRDTLVLERFFDESGGTQLVIHSPYGSRLNRAWGLALRKRFCRKFNFELQAAATENAIVLSLSTSHSFPLIEVAGYLHSYSAEHILVQALLDAPLFGARWRWNATTALALPRFVGGKKVTPQLQRMRSEDLLASVFPDQVACLENIVGEREIPDHPLVAQTLDDCLHEAMDTEGWLALLRRMESGEVEVLARDVTAPSPFAAEALNARPYAFLDDAPLEERRTQAVATRGYADRGDAGDLSRLDPEAIREVGEQAWPRARNADEMHEALMGVGCVTAREALANPGWSEHLQALADAGRATRASVGGSLWFAAERLPLARALYPGARCVPEVAPPREYATEQWTREQALVEVLRGRLSALGVVSAGALADQLALPQLDVDMALAALESEGYAMRGHFTATPALEWCERGLLARVHRKTIGRLRKEIQPVAPHEFMRFLFAWQRVAKATRASGPEALAGVLGQLEGFEAPAGAWEAELLPARVSDYSPAWLDDLCTAGRVAWARLRPAASDGHGGSAPVKGTPIALLPRRQLALWTQALAQRAGEEPELSSRAQKVADCLRAHGASFFDELLADAGLLRPELEDALAELVVRGRVHCDSYAGLRALMVPPSRRGATHRRAGRLSLTGISDAGRWTLARRHQGEAPAKLSPEAVEHVARTLLRRYGVVGWRLLEREAAWLPPWRELLRVYHRLEARGEVRGGRFVAGLSGEQFALPEAVASLRQVRRSEPDGELLVVSASDPLNLAGTVLPGSKVPRLAGARVLYRDGIALAALVAGKVEHLVEPLPIDAHEAKRLLLREPESPFATSLARAAVEHAADGDPEAASAEVGPRR
ncbi:DEAD/DEAH box helicase [Cognatiluteimonas lumbrici]|uniref:DEAD/DEAH box helicase n=1 Tax=Cognatiluteimonas lumbrici TaxID=2559601 RepID=UPI00112CA79D|nr:DEAD/DEAH box helicase [Luteimonas lumbrici]